jgi:hypothetical protein
MRFVLRLQVVQQWVAAPGPGGFAFTIVVAGFVVAILAKYYR